MDNLYLKYRTFFALENHRMSCDDCNHDYKKRGQHTTEIKKKVSERMLVKPDIDIGTITF